MTAPRVGRCKGCHAEILWAQTRTGGWMPLDSKPVPDGNVILTMDGTAAVLGRAHPAWPGDRYDHHKVSCPNAKEFRRKTR